MQELDDIALLRQYVDQNSEEAFAALVSRHVNKVYSVALRHTRNPHQAEEITQAVFVILAKKSPQLDRKVVLSGWLYETSRLTAITFMRSDIRRARREQEACMQTLLNEEESDVWPQIAPLLDTAIAGLSETDRHAVVLRFFDGKSMKEVGVALGASERGDCGKFHSSRAGRTGKIRDRRGAVQRGACRQFLINIHQRSIENYGLVKSKNGNCRGHGHIARHRNGHDCRLQRNLPEKNGSV
jgi:RNA polymerase sigma factor (sigma-70 family)